MPAALLPAATELAKIDVVPVLVRHRFLVQTAWVATDVPPAPTTASVVFCGGTRIPTPGCTRCSRRRSRQA